jgi:hypothetical protein
VVKKSRAISSSIAPRGIRACGVTRSLRVKSLNSFAPYQTYLTPFVSLYQLNSLRGGFAWLSNGSRRQKSFDIHGKNKLKNKNRSNETHTTKFDRGKTKWRKQKTGESSSYFWFEKNKKTIDIKQRKGSFGLSMGTRYWSRIGYNI